MEKRAAGLRGSRGFRIGSDALLDRIGFAGQQCFVDLSAVEASTIPSAGTRSPAQSCSTSPATMALTGSSSGLPSRSTVAWSAIERLSAAGRGLRPMFLHHVEQRREDHHGQNDDEACKVSGDAGDGGCDEQDGDQRIGEAVEQVDEDVAPGGFPISLGPSRASRASASA
jgi:hypothetical protein